MPINGNINKAQLFVIIEVEIFSKDEGLKFLCRLKINENFLWTSKTPSYKEVIVAHSLH